MYDNLTLYTFKTSSTKTRTVEINTHLLTGARIKLGRRSSCGKNARRGKFIRKKFKEKYPILSKFFNPFHINEFDWVYDYFEPSQIILEVCNKEAVAILFSHNDLAKTEYAKFKALMWGVKDAQ